MLKHTEFHSSGEEGGNSKRWGIYSTFKFAVKPEQGSDCASVSSRGKNNHPFTALTIGIPAWSITHQNYALY